MERRLPHHIRPAVLARHRTRLEGTLRVGELPRLSELCRAQAARIEAALEFEYETGSGRLMMGVELHGELELTCQRCLSAMRWRLDHTNRLVVADGPQTAASLPRDTDHIVCTTEEIAPAGVVEEEVLLALPQIPAHDHIGQCDAAMVAHLGGAGRGGDNPAGGPADAPAGSPDNHPDNNPANNPFGILRNIRL
ncbi:MAG: YceD family protein [Gammaproteobacteria bacterium]|nr:YceD family protein [Gammaproteobacteria bacterium]MDD9869137.1 YceD family protein [Gammaproteobacteria bacterium]